MICLVGSGNVATWLLQRLRGCPDFPVAQVYSRQMDHARAAAAIVGAEAVDDPAQLDPRCRIFIFALRDDALPQVLSRIPFKMPFAVHTAGSVPQETLAPHAEHYGVLYPLQTFSKNTDMSALKVPLCVECDHAGPHRELLMSLAGALSDTVRLLNGDQRFYAHLASVFACNFSNAMCVVAQDILQQHEMSLDLILPLLEQTVTKLQTLPPREAQTGPACRGDEAVMGRHLQALTDPRWQEIYRLMSDFIQGNTLYNSENQ
ncbi:MAG: DUF2520 domain-containing protein [Bacteroidales bacterium]|nr:DUF2520 domain-containing protein [Bacteroidales bacterium]